MSRLRTRLPYLLGLWTATAVVEGVLYYFFLSRPYFRAFFTPFAAALLLAALASTWRLLRPRHGRDRRSHDRRAHQRRARG